MNRILIWGTGDLAKQFIENGYSGEIIGYIETRKTKNEFMQRPVYDICEIPKEYDYIIVANSYGTEIYATCIIKNIDMSKMIFLYGVNNKIGHIDQSVVQEVLAEKNYALYCKIYKIKPQENNFVDADAAEYQRLNKRKNFEIQEKYMWPIISERCSTAGNVDNYFWQDLWAARLIYRSGVREHFDIGSRIDGFIAHLLAMDIKVSIIDIRRFPCEIENLYTIVDNATNLNQVPDESIESMSALCSLEHFGLGRYGDPIDPEACFTCFKQIQKKLKRGGKLYLSVPVGMERVEFNAHRVFYADTILKNFYDMQLEEFSCCTVNKMEYDVDIHKYDNDEHDGNYRYGLFYFIKK